MTTTSTKTHEPDLLPLRAFFILAICFIVAGLLLHLLLWWFMGVIARGQGVAHVDQPRIRPVMTSTAPLQPSPNHPSLPWQDLAALKAAQERDLNEPTNGAMPIQRAFDLALARNLFAPTTSPSTQPYLRKEDEQ